MTIRKILSPDSGKLDEWLVEEGDVIERGTPLALVDIQGELRQIESEYAGIVQTLELTAKEVIVARTIMAVVDAFDSKSRRDASMVANTKLNRDIRAIVDEVVTPKFKEVSQRFDGVDKRLAAMDSKIDNISAKLDKSMGEVTSKLDKLVPAPPGKS